jgi:hypothetical protein
MINPFNVQLVPVTDRMLVVEISNWKELVAQFGLASVSDPPYNTLNAKEISKN